MQSNFKSKQNLKTEPVPVPLKLPKQDPEPASDSINISITNQIIINSIENTTLNFLDHHDKKQIVLFIAIKNGYKK